MIDFDTASKILKLASIWAFMIFAVAGLALAQDSNRAGVVVRLSDDEVETKCVVFEEEQITGYEALRRSGLPVLAGFDAQGGTVCQISDVGCPADNCFCQCKGGPECTYWSYWHRLDESWQYALVGATAFQVSDKDVEGWSWGPGSVSQAIEPPDLTFDDICESTLEAPSSNQDSEISAPINWLQYVFFGAILGLLAVSLIVVKIRGRNQ
jgi:hypothetical protein